MKGDKVAKRSSFGNVVRKRLSDITNSLPQQNSPVDMENNDAVSAKDYIDHLVKENMALVKLIQDKNKVIELSGAELRKMRVNLQKMQLQNWNLAQSNSHMLAELNLNKDKLKSLQHEIACKEALYKAKILEAKEQESVNVAVNQKQEQESVNVAVNEKQEQESINVAVNEKQDEEEAVVENNALPNAETKPSTSNRPPCATRSRSMSHSTASQQAAKEEAAEKRPRLRRQSASSRMQQQKQEQQTEQDENFFELEDIAPPASQTSNRRSSFVGRPLRKAAEKVQSYKETPLNVKMRRPE